MSPIIKVSNEQLELLVSFFEINQNTDVNSSIFQEDFAKLCEKLNAMESSKKTLDTWKRYWCEFKYKTKMKAKEYHRCYSELSTKTFTQFTDFERRTVYILWPNLLEVNIDKNKDQSSSTSSSDDKTRSEKDKIENDTEDNMNVDLDVTPPSVVPPSSHNPEQETPESAVVNAPSDALPLPPPPLPMEQLRNQPEIMGSIQSIRVLRHTLVLDCAGEPDLRRCLATMDHILLMLQNVANLAYNNLLSHQRMLRIVAVITAMHERINTRLKLLR